MSDKETSWLIGELQQDYVGRQLHPYGTDVLLHEHFSEEQVLNLVLNKPIPVEQNKLETGFVLHGKSTEYQIHRFLGCGCFGFAYTAASHNLKTGEKTESYLFQVQVLSAWEEIKKP